MGEKFSISKLDLYYGDFHALKNINMSIQENLLRKRVGMVFQKPNPFPMSIYDNIAYDPRTHGIHAKARLDEIVEKSLRDAAIWDEVKDRLKKSALCIKLLLQQQPVARDLRLISAAFKMITRQILQSGSFIPSPASTRTELSVGSIKLCGHGITPILHGFYKKLTEDLQKTDQRYTKKRNFELTLGL